MANWDQAVPRVSGDHQDSEECLDSLVRLETSEKMALQDQEVDEETLVLWENPDVKVHQVLEAAGDPEVWLV